MGVPIFQEQVIQLAMVAAGFSGGEADQLRRAMASWKKDGRIFEFRDKLIKGMTDKGYDSTFAHNLFEQIKGFAGFGYDPIFYVKNEGKTFAEMSLKKKNIAFV